MSRRSLIRGSVIPSEVLQSGQGRRVKVLKVNREGESAQDRLSIKALEAGGRAEKGLGFEEGQIISVRFLDWLISGPSSRWHPVMDGLVHVSEISY